MASNKKSSTSPNKQPRFEPLAPFKWVHLPHIFTWAILIAFIFGAIEFVILSNIHSKILDQKIAHSLSEANGRLTKFFKRK